MKKNNNWNKIFKHYNNLNFTYKERKERCSESKREREKDRLVTGSCGEEKSQIRRDRAAYCERERQREIVW